MYDHDKCPKMRATVESTLTNGQVFDADPLPDHAPTPMLETQPLSKTFSNGTNSHSETWEPPPSAWIPQCHRRAMEVASEVDDYFLQNWLFPSHKSKRAFLNAGFSRVTCLYFPMAKDDRISYACRLLTVLFLIDGKGPCPPALSFSVLYRKAFADL